MEDVFERLWDIDEEELEEALDELQVTRGNAELLLDAIECYDMPLLYYALIDRFEEQLSAAELKAVKMRYKERFDLPL